MPSTPAPEPPPLSGRRIFLTGATGFVGRSLLDCAAASARRHGGDFEIVGLSRDPQAFLARHPRYAALGWLSLRQGDILAMPPPDGSFTDVLHAAAETHARGDAVQWTRQIVDGTRAALDFAARAGASRFLHVSSGAVYGPQPADVAGLGEDTPLTAPAGHYGEAKRLAERLCAAQGGVNARCFAFVGRHLPLAGPFAIGNFIRDALYGDEIAVQGDGRAIRSYLDARDMARWLLCLLRDGAPGLACNVGSDRAMSMVELAHRVADCLAPGKRVAIQGAPDAAGRAVYVPSVRRAAALGLHQEIALESALADVAAVLRGRATGDTDEMRDHDPFES